MKRFLFVLFLMLMITSAITSNALAASLAWDENDQADYYVVYCKASSDSNWTDVYKTTSEKETTVNLENLLYKGEKLKTNTLYYFTVKAFNVYGNSSDFADSVDYTIYKPFAPVLNISKHSIAWTYEDNPELAGFEITIVSGSALPLVTKVDKTVKSMDLVPLNLANNSSNTITVKAFSATGVYSDSSNSVIYTRRSPSKVINIRINKTVN